MCQRLRDIFFPTNVLGKDKRTIKFSLASLTPSMHHLIFDIQFVGERLEVCYTQIANYGKQYRQQSFLYEDGDGTLFNFDIHPYDRNGDKVRNGALDELIYFKCTNVTSLIVDGQQLI